MKTSLEETQKIFIDAVLNKCWDENEHPAEKFIKKTDSVSNKHRLAIYRNTSITTQLNALKNIYVVCEKILGERVFKKLAREYILRHRSTVSDLNLYGQLFPKFINELQMIQDFKDYYYLQDLCLIEWLWHAAYYAKDDGKFDFNAFQTASEQEDEIVLKVSHALELIETDYPVFLIWRNHRSSQENSQVAGLDEKKYLCIFRDEYIPNITTIKYSDYEFLLACKNELSLQALSSDEKYCSAMQSIPNYIERGWICSFVSFPS